MTPCEIRKHRRRAVELHRAAERLKRESWELEQASTQIICDIVKATGRKIRPPCGGWIHPDQKSKN